MKGKLETDMTTKFESLKASMGLIDEKFIKFEKQNDKYKAFMERKIQKLSEQMAVVNEELEISVQSSEQPLLEKSDEELVADVGSPRAEGEGPSKKSNMKLTSVLKKRTTMKLGDEYQDEPSNRKKESSRSKKDKESGRKENPIEN